MRKNVPELLKLKKLLQALLLPAALLFFPVFLYADQLPPSGSSADVIGEKAREEAKKKLLERKPLEESSVKTEKPPAAQQPATPFFIRKINLEGNKVVDPKKLEPLIIPYENRNVTFDELNVLCGKLEEVFRNEGYVAVVYVPPQKVTNGELTLSVFLAHMGELHIEGARYFRESSTRSYWRIPKGELLRYDAIHESMEDMNNNPDRKAQAVLKPGKETGTTDINIKEEDHFPIHIGASVDNQGVKLTGHERGGFTLTDNNLLGLDDQLVAGTVFGEDFGTVYVQHQLPLSPHGTRLISNYSYAQVNPKKEFEPLGINGISSTVGFELHQRLLRTDYFYSEVYAGFNFKDKKNKVLSQIQTKDRLRVISTGATLQNVDSSGSWTLMPSFHFGLPFNDEDTALTSRRAGSSFFKSEVSVSRLQKMPWGTRALLSLDGQLSPDNLVPQEELFLGGANSVRGYPESDYGADQGLVTNLEYWIPASSLPIPDALQIPWMEKPLNKITEFVAFLDYGYGKLNNPSGSEVQSRSLIGTGLGLSIRPNQNWSIRLSWGFPIGDRALTEGGQSQFYWRVQGDY